MVKRSIAIALEVLYLTVWSEGSHVLRAPRCICVGTDRASVRNGGRLLTIPMEAENSLRMPTIMRSVGEQLDVVDHRALVVHEGSSASVRFGVRIVLADRFQFTAYGTILGHVGQRTPQLYMFTAIVSKVEPNASLVDSVAIEKLAEFSLNQRLEIEQLLHTDIPDEPLATVSLSLSAAGSNTHGTDGVLSLTRSRRAANLFFIEQRSGPNNEWTPILKLSIVARSVDPRISRYMSRTQSKPFSRFESNVLLTGQTFKDDYSPESPFLMRPPSITISVVVLTRSDMFAKEATSGKQGWLDGTSLGMAGPPLYSMSLGTIEKADFAQYDQLESHFHPITDNSRAARYEFSLVSPYFEERGQSVTLRIDIAHGPDSEVAAPRMDVGVGFGLDVRWKDRSAYISYVAYKPWASSRVSLLSEFLVMLELKCQQYEGSDDTEDY